MSRPGGPGRPGRRRAEPVELAVLRGWLRNAKGSRTFDSLAHRATEAGMPISECTLRRAVSVGGQLPRWYTVLAFTQGASADGDEAESVWEAAALAVRPQPIGAAGDRYVPGRFTTRAGMAEAMARMRAAAGDPTLDAIAAAGGGQFSRSALHNAMTGQRLASEQLLIGFAAAIGAGERATRALLDGRARILAGTRSPAFYPCEVADRADERRQQDEAVRSWLVEPELDWYDQHLRDRAPARNRLGRRSHRRRAPRTAAAGEVGRVRSRPARRAGRVPRAHPPRRGGWPLTQGLLSGLVAGAPRSQQRAPEVPVPGPHHRREPLPHTVRRDPGGLPPAAPRQPVRGAHGTARSRPGHLPDPRRGDWPGRLHGEVDPTLREQTTGESRADHPAAAAAEPKTPAAIRRASREWRTGPQGPAGQLPSDGVRDRRRCRSGPAAPGSGA